MGLIEEKHKINAEKVLFAKNFKGLVHSLDSLIGKTVKEIITIDEIKYSILIFNDNTFIFHKNNSNPDPKDLIYSLLILSKTYLYEVYKNEFDEFIDMIQKDIELTRISRQENILGAIKTNIDKIPELFVLIPELLEKLSENNFDNCTTKNENNLK